MTKTMIDEEVIGEPASILLINFVKELVEAMNAKDMERAALAMRNCVVVSYAEQIKPIEYSQDG